MSGQIPPEYLPPTDSRPQRPSKTPLKTLKTRWLLLLGGAFAGLGAAIAGSRGQSPTPPPVPLPTLSLPSIAAPTFALPADGLRDVSINSCRLVASTPTATVKIRNPTNGSVSYFVSVDFVAVRQQRPVRSGIGFVDPVPPFQTVSRDIAATTPAPAGFTCRVVQATRFGG
jgi:hypothetical protein